MVKNTLFFLLTVSLGLCLTGCGGGDFCSMEAGDLAGTFVINSKTQNSCTCDTGNCAVDCEYAINDYGATCQDNKCTYTRNESPITITISSEGAITFEGQYMDQRMSCESLETDLCALKMRCTDGDGDYFEFTLTQT